MYRFIISYEYRGITAELPLPPDKMTTKLKGNTKVIDLVNSGEITVLKDIGLREISFRVLLPKDETVGISAVSFNPPIYFLSLFRNIVADRKPLRLIILRDLPDGTSIFNGDINLSIDSYTVTENGGEEGDFYVDLNFKEYRSPEAAAAEISSSGETKEETVRETKKTAETYTVVSGDCLWNIAKAQLGSGEKYRELAKLNGLSYPYNILPGQVLKLS
ncbi:MAG: LysM peptidoglycan-binding domain-containing protein [Clostridiales bacterium]|nr:LysM peptidoglycan-binding domain-containing protein [Clostridiales bacterium]